VWIGAIVTSLLFALGRFAISFYLQYSDPTSTYGAAGSLILILIWVYYSAQILFLGAEFTQVQANMFGAELRPERGAVFMTEAARATQGIPSETTKAQAAQQTAQPARGGGGRASGSPRPVDSHRQPQPYPVTVAASFPASSPGQAGKASPLVSVLEKLFYSVMVVPATLLGALRAWRK
jgi:membrane protein